MTEHPEKRTPAATDRAADAGPSPQPAPAAARTTTTVRPRRPGRIARAAPPATADPLTDLLRSAARGGVDPLARCWLLRLLECGEGVSSEDRSGPACLPGESAMD